MGGFMSWEVARLDAPNGCEVGIILSLPCFFDPNEYYLEMVCVHRYAHTTWDERMATTCAFDVSQGRMTVVVSRDVHGGSFGASLNAETIERIYQ